MTFIETFQTAYDAKDAGQFLPLMADDIVFHTSAAGRPVVAQAGALQILKMLLEVYEDGVFVAEYVNSTGVVLHSSGTIGGKRADGIQILTVDDSGLITEFRDFVRPLSALMALSEAAGRYLGGPNS